MLHVSWFLLILLVLLAARCVSLGLSLSLIPDLFMLWKPIAHFFRFLWTVQESAAIAVLLAKVPVVEIDSDVAETSKLETPR